MGNRRVQKVLADVRMWSHPGIGRYLRELFSAVLATKFPDVVFAGFEDAAVDLRRMGYRGHFHRLNSAIYSLSEQWELARVAAEYEVCHTPHFNVPVLRRGKLIATIHDLLYLKERKASRHFLGPLYAQILFRRALFSSRAILAVSESTRSDILAHFPSLNAAKITVTPEAASPQFTLVSDDRRREALLTKHSLSKPFILFVGSLKMHKNISGLLDAFECVRTRGVRAELVLVGRRDPKNGQLLRRIESSPSVRYLGELPDEDLVTIYNLCEVFVLPSFWEGFGLPVLEAMACGAPVISSNASSLPEVGGQAALYFNPNQIDALSAHLYNVLNDKELRKKMSALSLQRANEFSWNKTAEETVRVYRRVLA